MQVARRGKRICREAIPQSEGPWNKKALEMIGFMGFHLDGKIVHLDHASNWPSAIDKMCEFIRAEAMQVSLEERNVAHSKAI